LTTHVPPPLLLSALLVDGSTPVLVTTPAAT